MITIGSKAAHSVDRMIRKRVRRKLIKEGKIGEHPPTIVLEATVEFHRLRIGITKLKDVTKEIRGST